MMAIALYTAYYIMISIEVGELLPHPLTDPGKAFIF